jgi:hypothetical protein
MSSEDGTALLNSLSPQCSEMEINDGVGTLSFNLTEN